ncbi:MAG: ABC transporter ATP-binding protein [Candidatus Omnitrophica bacterium]|nr:ABC transporter ATP-binding protein [Candidatus Omnitrophota bacterium]
MPLLTVTGLSYTYPETTRPALRGVSCAVASGEMVLVTGPSGGGKSTLARIVGGLIPQFYGGTLRGSVTIDGCDVRRMPRRELLRAVGIVFQDPEKQIVCARVDRELAFGLENLGVPADAMRPRLREVARALPLERLVGRATTTLSSGEGQRVALGAVLAMRPRLLILDEPTSQLDPEAAEALLHHLRRLTAADGITMLLIEHRLDRCLAWADRVLHLEEGGIAYDGAAGAYEPWLATRGEGNAALEPTSCDGGAGPVCLAGEALAFAYPGCAPVLQGVSLAARAGEVSVILGANGAGKTTLLKLLAGLLRPAAGRILLEDRPLERMDRAQIVRRLGYLSQTPNDYLFHDTVLEEITYSLRELGLDDDGSAQQLMEELELTRYRQANPRDLSVGERQRVALASVLVTRPRVLLLDEPTRGLDHLLKAALAARLRRWAHGEGRAIVVVTHDRVFAASCADRRLKLSAGCVAAAAQEVVTCSAWG